MEEYKNKKEETMAIAQTIEEMREKLRPAIGDDIDYVTDEMIKEYYIFWFHGGSSSCDGSCC